MEDRDLRSLLVLDDVGADGGALDVVAPAGAEHGRVALRGGIVGQLDVRRRRRDLQDLAFLVDVRRGNGAARAVMPCHEHDLVRHHLVGHSGGLLGVAGIVADLQLELLAVHAARGVDVGHGHLGALAQLLSEGRILTGHRADGGDLDLREGRRHRQGQGCNGQRAVNPAHESLPFVFSTTWSLVLSLVPLIPAQQAFAPVQPGILPDHLAHARQAIGKAGDCELHKPTEHKSTNRPQLAVGQGVVEEAQARPTTAPRRRRPAATTARCSPRPAQPRRMRVRPARC